MIDPDAAFRLRALRLLEPSLSRLSSRPHLEKPADYLGRTLCERGEVGDDLTGIQLANQFIERESSPLEGLYALAQRLVTFRDGEPRCKDPNLWHRIAYEVDTDLIIAARMALSRASPPLAHACAQLAWPSVLAEDGLVSDVVQMRQLVDGHVHLGGALPGSFYWVAFMANFTPLYRLNYWDLDPNRWPAAIDEAMRLRQRLFETLFKQPYDRIDENYDDVPLGEDLPPEPFVDYLLLLLLPDRKDRLRHNPILGERMLLWRALSQILRKNCADPHLPAKFTRYLQLRNSFIYELAHKPGYPGLNRFQKTFDKQGAIWNEATKKRRSSKRRRSIRAALMLERFRVRHALRYQFSDPTDAPWARDHGAGLNPGDLGEATPWRPARQVELRVTPEMNNLQMRTIYAYLQGLADFVLEDRDAPTIRLGLVFHLLKRNQPADLEDVGYWAIRGLLGILDDVPLLRPFVVGIDGAGPERAASPRSMRSFFEYLGEDQCEPVFDFGQPNNAKKQPVQLTYEPQIIPGKPPVRLRRTYHAGEDFPDQLTGLHWMDDAVNLLQLRPGERLGHGLALFWKPDEWYAGRRVLKPHNQHLLDLIWCCSLARVNQTDLDLERDRGLDDLARAQLDAWLVTHEIERNFDKREFDAVVADYAIFRHERDILDRLQLPWKEELVSIDTRNNYRKLVKKIRKRVHRRICRGDIVLEACPTSNMLIGGFRGYEELPYLNLNRTGLRDEHKVAEPILVSLNTDNPGNFKTTIANEYRLMGRALKKMGYRARECARWLEEAREVGLASTFIPPWSPPTKQELLYAIDQIGGKTPRLIANKQHPSSERETQLAAGLVAWLQEHGFVRHGVVRHGGFSGFIY